eukprot:CAMPEP_0170451186 /NCGR_PEP_ID=MMETSP0123-20130129/512_1 /TAXON_ID=182087 /ORGANISM="Favella ehrenbergii, Strain Fehren 1" /LENGTH=33 /DNA_ID= /DNA_START= /DNA_END= /DNA_ORIENTATION=
MVESHQKWVHLNELKAQELREAEEVKREEHPVI